jgi:hypothetical protein
MYLLDNNMEDVKATFGILGDKWQTLKEYDENIFQRVKL